LKSFFVDRDLPAIMPFSWDFVNFIPVLGQIKAGVHLCLPNQEEEAKKALEKSNQSTIVAAAAIAGLMLGGASGSKRAMIKATENISAATNSEGSDIRGVAKILYRPQDPDSWIDGACTVVDEVVPEMNLRGQFVKSSWGSAIQEEDQ
jgi:hypothetical protein